MKIQNLSDDGKIESTIVYHKIQRKIDKQT